MAGIIPFIVVRNYDTENFIATMKEEELTPDGNYIHRVFSLLIPSYPPYGFTSKIISVYENCTLLADCEQDDLEYVYVLTHFICVILLEIN